jgi:hypothetical protein
VNTGAKAHDTRHGEYLGEARLGSAVAADDDRHFPKGRQRAECERGGDLGSRVYRNDKVIDRVRRELRQQDSLRVSRTLAYEQRKE